MGVALVKRILLKQGRLRPTLRIICYVLFLIAFTVALQQTYNFVRHTFPSVSKEVLSYPYSFIGGLGMVFGALFLRKYLDRESPATLGLGLNRQSIRYMGRGIIWGGAMMSAVFLVIFATGTVSIRGIAFPWQVLLAAVYFFTIGALVEELLMRGYGLLNLVEEIGIWPAVIVSSVLFSALHSRSSGFNWLAFAEISLAGFLFAVMYLSTRSLWFVTGVHAAWNLFEGPVFGMAISGLAWERGSVLNVSVTGPDFMTGGKFGPEASIPALVITTAAIIVFWLLNKYLVQQAWQPRSIRPTPH